jgi:hypothetical protein
VALAAKRARIAGASSQRHGMKEEIRPGAAQGSRRRDATRLAIGR